MKKHELIINGRIFYWALQQNSTTLAGHTFLDIFSADETFYISYLLGSDLIIVKGREFSDLPEAGLQWQWLETPVKGQEATPRLIKNLVDWSFTSKKIKKLNYKYIDSN